MLFDVPVESSIGFVVQRAQRAATRVFDLALQGAGLKFSQVVLLQTIATSKSPCNQTGLANLAGMDQSSINRALRPLIQRGLVEMAGADRGRGKIPRLTECGRRKLDQALNLFKEVNRELQNVIGPEACSRVCTELDKLAEAINAGCGAANGKRWRATHRRLFPQRRSGVPICSARSPEDVATAELAAIAEPQRACPECHAERLKQCSLCEGKLRPSRPGGTSIADCRRCSGTGRMACETCHGLGRVPLRSAAGRE